MLGSEDGKRQAQFYKLVSYFLRKHVHIDKYYGNRINLRCSFDNIVISAATELVYMQLYVYFYA